jgi:hypothetical protein
MADELRASLRMSYSKGGRISNTDDMGLHGLEIDVTGTDCIGPYTQTIGLTPAEIIGLGDITAPGYIVLKSISSYNIANYVTLRNGAAGADVVQLHGGDFAAFRCATGITLYADATGATQELLIWIVEA